MALNQVRRMPAVAEAVARVLSGAPGGRLQRASVLDRITPDASAGGRAFVDETISELVTIGALDDDGRLALPRGDTGNPLSMREAVLRGVMETARSADLWSRGEDGGVPSLTGAQDLARALAWLMLQPNLGAAWSFDGPASIDTSQAAIGFPIVRSATVWPFFVRWANYLGFATCLSANSIIPDPTRAVAPVLRAHLKVRPDQPLEALMNAVANDLPVLDGGVAQRGLREMLDLNWDANVSPAMTLALTRLRSRGMLEFDEGLGDAHKLTLSNGYGAIHAVRLSEGA
jgi:hypothetical protein